MKMKNLFCIILLIIASTTIRGQIKVHQHLHTWAGGICCSYGEEYKLTIKIPKGEWMNFDSLLVCTGSEMRRYGYSDLTKAQEGDTLILTVSYSYAYNKYGDHEFREPVKQIPCGNYLTLLKGYVRKQITVTSTSQSMTAYP
jgi:hypothetical protein